jgi:TonB-dependent receptor-like protein/carboxypeptidase family protein
MPRVGRSFAPVLVAGLLFLGGAAIATDAEAQSFPPGIPLTEALRELQRRGLNLVFSSAVVRPEMIVREAPRSEAPRAMLDEILAPHGLTVEESAGGSLIVVAASAHPARSTIRGSVRSRAALVPLPGVSVGIAGRSISTTTDSAGRYEISGVEPGTYTVHARRPGFVIEERANVSVTAGASADVSFVLQPAPLAREEVVVHPSRITVLQEEPGAPLALDREEVLRLPHLGADVFRTLSLLPGTTSNDVTAQFHVRGGRRDEVLVLLDGQELYEAYHLKEFDNALSLVAASNLANVDLTTGSFPSSYGDRMGGILDLSTITPSKPRQLRLSVSILNAQLEGSGTLGERGWWLASVRRGTTDLTGRMFGAEDPVFWDAFAKVDYRPTTRQSARVNVLHSEDQLDFVESRGEEITRLDTSYDNSYLWLTHQIVLSDRLFVDTVLSGSRVDRNRRGFEDEDEKTFDVRDLRDLDVIGGLQSWNLQTSARNFLKAGFELRRFDARYDYFSFRRFDSPLALVRSEPREGEVTLNDRFRDDHVAAYVSDRLRPLDPLTVEAGLRYDRHSLTDDSVWSPRVNAAWGVGRGSVLRVGWGWYHQSQRAYELLVEDGDTSFYKAERSEQWVAGFEHLFDAASAGPLRGLRAEVYTRRIRDPRPRYESLFEAFERFPEGELARIRVEPESGRADGFELSLQGTAGSRIDWWLNYGWATTDERVEGRDVPRSIDQRHTVNADVNYRLGRDWDVNVAWRYHTGWPTTPVSAEVRDGGVVPVLGPRNSDRLTDYHRLDARLSRRWQFRVGRLSAFIDVQNVYNRRNAAGQDVEIRDTGQVIKKTEEWPGFFGSAGFTLEF